MILLGKRGKFDGYMTFVLIIFYIVSLYKLGDKQKSCTFKNLLKTSFSIRNILLQFVSGVFGLYYDISYSKNRLLID